MAEDLYPSLPPKDYRISRLMRLSVLSLVWASLIVGMLVVVFRWIVDTFKLDLDRNGVPDVYTAYMEFLIPSIVIIAYIIGRVIWDKAEGREPRPASKKPA